MSRLISRYHFRLGVCVVTILFVLLLNADLIFSAVREESTVCNRTSQFPVFDATLYTNKPDLSTSGMLPIVGAYAGHFGNSWRRSPNKLPPKEKVYQVAREAVDKASIVFLDIEHWPHKGDHETVMASMRKYIQVARWFREAAPGLALGYYGVPPVKDYWRAINSPSSDDYLSWLSDNDELRPLADTMDIFFPSLYTFYNDREGWQRHAIAQIAEAHRYSGGKPVYVFLWPQFHDSNRELAWKYLPVDFWRLELEAACQYADGIVIWGGWGPKNRPTHWNEHAPWWRTTKEFLAKLRGKGPNQRTLTAPRHLRVQ